MVLSFDLTYYYTVRNIDIKFKSIIPIIIDLTFSSSSSAKSMQAGKFLVLARVLLFTLGISYCIFSAENMHETIRNTNVMLKCKSTEVDEDGGWKTKV